MKQLPRSRHRKHPAEKSHPRKPQPRPEAAPRGAFSWRWPLVILGMLVVAASTWALFEFVVWNTLPANLVGKWVVTGGTQDGATFDFYRNGTMVGNINAEGRTGIINASVRVEDNQLLITTVNPNTGRNETKTQTIKTLTATQLILLDEQGETYTLERAE
jgi:uncharacterized protein (TIGR03066 family)